MHGQSETYKTYMYFHFFSPEGKKFRSKTEVERYIFEKGLNVDPASIDFTVRGAKNSKKPNIVRAQLQGGKPKKDKTPKLKKDKTPKANVSKTRSPEGSPKKSLAQKLVIKMKFSTPPKGGTVSKLTKRRSSSSKAVKKKVETKGVKRKADKLTKPPSKRAKIAIKSKTEGKGVKKKVTLPKPKAKKEKKAVQEEQEDDENEEEMEDEEEEVEDEEEADEEENSADAETQSDGEAEEEADIERTYDENYDASDYRYSLEEEAINQVDDSDDDEEEEEEDEEVEGESEEEGEANDDVDIEQYEKESPFVDQVKSENVRVVEETDNVVDAEVVEAESLDVVVGENHDTDNDSAVEESVDTAQCFPESGEDTDNTGDEHNDRYKVEQLLNRTEGMTVQDAYETSIRLGHFSDLQKVQRRSPRATPSRFGNSARRNSYEKSRSFSDSYEWEPIHPVHTRRKSQTNEGSKDVNENNNIVVHAESLKKSISDSKVLVRDNKSETESSKSETVQSVKQSPRPKRKAALGSQVLERNNSVEASPIKTETSQSVKQSPRLKRKSSSGGKVSETN